MTAETLVGRPLVPYAIGDPGRAAREVVPRITSDATHPPDMRIDAGEAGPLVVRAASRRGLLHAYAGTPRQDDYALWADGQRLVVAIADGVSAGPLSHYAAAGASRSAVGHAVAALAMTREPARVDWPAVLGAISNEVLTLGRQLLGASAADHREVGRQLATTLAIAVVDLRPDVAGDHTAMIVGVGDVGAYVLSADGGWGRHSPSKPDARTVASNATDALPSAAPDAWHGVTFAVPRGGALLVMTDGVADAIGSGDGVVGGHLGRIWAAAPDPVSFCGQIGFARRTFDDDRTVVGVWAPRPDDRPSYPHRPPSASQRNSYE